MLRRRPISLMPVGRRGEGLTVLERVSLYKLRLEKNRLNLMLQNLLLVLDDSSSDDEPHSSSDEESDADTNDSDSSSDDEDDIILIVYGMLTDVERKIRAISHKIPDPLPPIGLNKHVTLDNYTPGECYDLLRFRKAEIRTMLDFFAFDEVLHLDRRLKVYSETAFIFMLRRLGRYKPYNEYRVEFSRGSSELSVIFNYMVREIARRYRHCVVANIDWYANRFNEYEQAIREFLRDSRLNTALPDNYLLTVQVSLDLSMGPHIL